MGANKNLNNAKTVKDDEFYTRLEDIENEVKNYKSHFKDKTVYCNCDDPEWSNFYKYFTLNFKFLGLKKLISTHYTKDLQTDPAYKKECVLDANGNLVETKTDLLADGDFRSDECIELLKESDIVCTNPPFSLLRIYITQLLAHNKKFLIIGPKNAITYIEIFPSIIANELWLGINNVGQFLTPTKQTMKFGNVGWFTNLTHKKRTEHLILWREYNKDDYPTYDNYAAIEVSKVADIPIDYFGEMGVPITFLEKYNPNQFTIIGSYNNGEHGAQLGAKKTQVESKGKYLLWNGPAINKKALFKRIIIKHKNKDGK